MLELTAVGEIFHVFSDVSTAVCRVIYKLDAFILESLESQSFQKQAGLLEELFYLLHICIGLFKRRIRATVQHQLLSFLKVLCSINTET